jgi:hypothetical protein
MEQGSEASPLNYYRDRISWDQGMRCLGEEKPGACRRVLKNIDELVGKRSQGLFRTAAERGHGQF